MSRLVVISNRVPPPNARSRAHAGGLAAALSAALKSQRGLWFGWSGEVVSEQTRDVKQIESSDYTLATIDLSKEDHDEYYNGFANRTLWPLCHYRTDLVAYDRSYSVGYYRVNALFAESCLPLLKPDDLIWVHDYHLIPCGENLRRHGVKQRIGFFLHIPWPSAELMVTLPHHQALVRALFAYDLIGFQTERDVNAFRDYVLHEAGGIAVDHNYLSLGNKVARIGAFPIGIDPEDMPRLAVMPEARRHVTRMVDSLNGRTLIIGVDRLDYSKGIDRRFNAYGKLLELHPEHHQHVSMLQVASPSRMDVAEYRAMRRQLERQIGSINGKYADFDWVPLRYVNRTYDHAALAGLYRSARVALVTPLRDGMNLVAKEYVAAQNPADPGVLILSRFAGAATQLRDALIVNPYDQENVVNALQRALSMPLDARLQRWNAMMQVIRTTTVQAWRESFLAALDTISTRAMPAFKHA